MDVMSPTQRYRAMAHNRGRTRPERAVASALWRRGLRFFTYDGYRAVTGKSLTGKPDLVFPRKRVVVFVDGCFWHGCNVCRKSPEKSGEFWLNKIKRNTERDARVTAALEEEGWIVLRVPEHVLLTKKALQDTTQNLIQELVSAQNPGETHEGRRGFMPVATGEV